MVINWNIEYLPKPAYVVSHYIHSNVNRMKQNIANAGVVNVSVTRRTKTTVEIRMSHGEDSFCVAHKPAGAERFKFVEANEYSFFDTRANTRYYFRISKKQNLRELKDYLELVINEMGLQLDTLEVQMKITGVDELKN